MQFAEFNDYVIVEYEGRIASTGEVFDSTEHSVPLEFQVGNSEVLPEFEKAIIGMAADETKIITLPPEHGFGKIRPELIQAVDRDIFKGKIDPQPGMILGLTMEKDGGKHQVPAMVTKVDAELITVDYNHPLAGKELTYKITLRAIQKNSGEQQA